MKWKLLTAVLMGLTLLVKVPGLLLFPIFGIYYFYKKKDIASTVKDLAVPFLVSFSAFASFILFAKLDGTIYHNMFGSVASTVHGFTPFPLIYLALWATPFLLAPFALRLLKPSSQDALPLLWVFLTIIFYSFVGVVFISPFDRYLMLIIPPLAMLGGALISKLSLNPRHLAAGLLAFIISLAIIVQLNSGNEYVAHSIPGFIERALKLSWNFYFPITSGSGPSFFAGFPSIAFSFIAISASLLETSKIFVTFSK